MEDYQERVIAEKDDLDFKIEKLDMFIGSDFFNNLPMDEQKRLRRQQMLMEMYSDILGERIENFK